MKTTTIDKTIFSFRRRILPFFMVCVLLEVFVVCFISCSARFALWRQDSSDDVEELSDKPLLLYSSSSPVTTNNDHNHDNGNYNTSRSSTSRPPRNNNHNNTNNKELDEEFAPSNITTADHHHHHHHHPPQPIIDAVITWVNASEPLFLDELNKHSKEANMTIHKRRYRDNGELRYTMRSIHKYAPWIRQIFLVVSSKRHQIPYWLDVDHPYVTVIEHKDIWEDPTLLPVYASSLIEPHLHRIPGLSDDFLYFNDDIMLSKPLDPYRDVWFSKKRERIIYSSKTSYPDPNATGYNQVLASNHQLYVQKYGERRNVKALKKFAHVPYFFNKFIWQEIRSIYFKEEYDEFLLNATRHKRRFRSRDSIWLQSHTMYNQFLMWNLTKNATKYPYLYTQVTYSNKNRYYTTIRLRNNYTKNQEKFDAFLGHQTKFLNVQDKFDNDEAKIRREVRNQIQDFFDKQYPIEAPWELQPCTSCDTNKQKAVVVGAQQQQQQKRNNSTKIITPTNTTTTHKKEGKFPNNHTHKHHVSIV